MTLAERLLDLKQVMNDLTVSDVTSAADFPAWTRDWGVYGKNGGDRPPVKPPTP